MPHTPNYSPRLRVTDDCPRCGHTNSGKEPTD